MTNLSLKQSLKALMDAFAADQQFSGVAIIAQEGEPLLRKAYGTANYAHSIANCLDTKFLIASITKPITAVAVLMLVERGLIDFSRSCLSFLPEGFSLDERITPHHLLTHTSGIPDFETMPGYSELGKQAYTNEEVIGLVRHLPPDFAPGEGWKYCNTGYNLLAMMIEHVSGTTYDDFIASQIFNPLGMKDTRCSYNRFLVPNLASGYSRDAQTGDLVNALYFEAENFKGSGNLYSTADDLLKWDRALYTEQLISADSLRLIFTPHAAIDENRAYGYGFSLYRNGSRGHGGWLPGYWSKFMQYPDRQIAVILLGNHDFVQENCILDRIAERFD